eukprot:Opistho-2@10014
MFAPSAPHSTRRTRKGERTIAVNARDTTAGGRFSGSRNRWVITGLGPKCAGAAAVAGVAARSAIDAAVKEMGASRTASPTMISAVYSPETPPRRSDRAVTSTVTLEMPVEAVSVGYTASCLPSADTKRTKICCAANASPDSGSRTLRRMTMRWCSSALSCAARRSGYGIFWPLGARFECLSCTAISASTMVAPPATFTVNEEVAWIMCLEPVDLAETSTEYAPRWGLSEWRFSPYTLGWPATGPNPRFVASCAPSPSTAFVRMTATPESAPPSTFVAETLTSGLLVVTVVWTGMMEMGTWNSFCANTARALTVSYASAALSKYLLWRRYDASLLAWGSLTTGAALRAAARA